MKVLSLSLDKHILNKESVVASRNIRYGEILESYNVVVPSEEEQVVGLSGNATVYGTGGKNKVVQFWRMWFLCTRLIKQERPDVITSQDTYFLGLLGVLLSQRYHTGLEVQVLGIEKLSPLRKLLSQFVLRRAGSIRVLSLGLKKRLVDEFHIPEERMMLVPIYVDVSSLGLGSDSGDRELIEAEVKKFTDQYSGRFNIVSVNRLVPIKNIGMQIEAVVALKTEFPNILLHIVGDGPLTDEIATGIKKNSLTDNVILHGYKRGATLSPFFTHNDCFVLTSDFEGFGMVIIEAATAGSVIVMTDVGCAGEVIKNEESGLIVPPRETAAFISALRSIITDQALRERLKTGALRAIADLPSFDTVLEKYKASWQQAKDNTK